LLIVNLGLDLHVNPAPEPLLAPPAGRRWKVIFSTESVCYGGCGTPPLESEENWWIPGHAAVALAPEEATGGTSATSPTSDSLEQSTNSRGSLLQERKK
jgi:hypothetical protein